MSGETAGKPSGRALALLPVLAGLFVLAFYQVCDPDVFWQIKVGEVVLDTGRMVRTNVFAASYADHPWFNPEWLFQVGIALAYRGGGWVGVALFKFALLGVLAGLLHALLLARRRAPLLAAGIALAVFAAMRFRFTERPQLASLILFTATLLVVERARAGRPRLLWALPPLFALWSNLHAELLLGILWLAGTAVGGWVDARLARRRAGEAVSPAGGVGPGRLALAALACALASGANPGGYRVLYHPFPHFWQESIVDLGEFHWSHPAWVPLVWVLIAAVVATACVPRTRRAFADLLPLLGLAVLAVRYMREIPFFALAAAPWLQGALPGLLPDGRRARRWLEAGVAAAALGCGVWAMRFDASMHYRWGYGVSDFFPVQAADFVLREKLPGNLYNHYIDGGYLLFRLYPRLGVYQDGRLSAYPVEFMARMHAQHNGREWAENLETYRINTAVVPVVDARLFFPADRWQVVHADARYAVVVRRSAANAGLIAHLTATAQARTPAGEAYLRGSQMMRSGRYADAAAAYREATRLDPAYADAWHNLGSALAAEGRIEEGIAALEEALRLRPDFAMARSRLEFLRTRRAR